MSHQILSVVTLFLFAASLSAADWKQSLTPLANPVFPEVRPFEATFTFGWSNILKAGTARAKFENMRDNGYQVHVTGQSQGLVRSLWKLDAQYHGEGDRRSYVTRHFKQLEIYAKKKLEMEAYFDPEGVWRFRQGTPGDPAKWKHFSFPNLRDLVSTMLFIRSQPLQVGDKISVATYPGDSIFCTMIKVVSKEKVKFHGEQRDTLKLSFDIQKLVIKGKKKGQLEPHPKFKRGTVWISNDKDRLPLRVEVNIFIGYVYGELESVTFLPET